MATDIVPPTRRLVICCDGTWNSAGAPDAATNVLRLARAVKAVTTGTPERPGIPQIVHYEAGVGTGNWVDRVAGGAVGVGLTRNLRDAYAFIVDNYQPGAEILLFGFSRGAYTARALGGLIQTIGLLETRDMGGFPDAWAWYRQPRREHHQAAFEARFPDRVRDVAIRCIGVWDTVGSLGIPASGPGMLLRKVLPRGVFCTDQYQFLDTKLGPRVQHAFQALAINEKRSTFRPTLWQRHPDAPASQVLRQVWFPGVHSDVGGGYAEHGTSDIAYLWMIAQIRKLLELDDEEIRAGLDTRKAYGTDVLHDTYTRFWKLFGPYQRHFDRLEQDGHAVHQSALDRIKADTTYEPNRRIEGKHEAVEPYSDIEAGFRWTQTPWRTRPPLVTPRSGICDRIVQFLGGD